MFENLLWCAYLYPEDDELAEARIQFIPRDEVRAELSPLEQSEIDEPVSAELERRETAAVAAVVEEKVEEPGPVVAEPVSATGGDEGKPPRSNDALALTLTIGELGVMDQGVVTGFLIHSGAKKGRAHDTRGEWERLDAVCVGSDSPEKCQSLEDALRAAGMSRMVGMIGLAAGDALALGEVLACLFSPKTTKASDQGPPLHPRVKFVKRGITLGIAGRF